MVLNRLEVRPGPDEVVVDETAHRPEEARRVAVGEAGDADDSAMDGEEGRHHGVAVDAIVLLDVAADDAVALGEPHGVEAVLEVGVLLNRRREDVDVLVHRHEEAVVGVGGLVRACGDTNGVGAEVLADRRRDALHARVEARVAHAVSGDRG